MKKLSRILCFCLICICMLGNLTVSAVDLNKTGSISCLSYIDGEHVSDVPVRLWHIANYDSDKNQFDLLPEYANYNLYFNPNDVDVISRFAKTLYDYIQRDSLISDKLVYSDTQGSAMFELLRPGVYLIASDEFKYDGKFYSAQPTLVYLPNLSDNSELVFSAEIELKFTGRRIPDESKPELVSRRVLKIWSDDGFDESSRPRYIKVDLLRNGRVYDTVELSEKNGWRHVWTDLNKSDSWSVVEHYVPDGYKTYVDKQGVTFVIENVKQADNPPPETPWKPPVVTPPVNPVAPVVPVDPGVPGAPATPEPPVTPSHPVVPNDPKIPQTGQLWWPVPVFTILGLIILLAGVFYKKRDGLSNLLVFVGVLFVLASLGLTMRNLYEDEQVRINTDVIEDAVSAAKLSDYASSQYDELYIPDYQLDPEFEMPVFEHDDREYIGILDIDALGLSLPVISEFTYSNLKVAPVRYVGDIYDGTCIIGAHNYSSHFGKIGSLNVGDSVRFTDMDGNIFEYTVSGQEILPGTDVSGLCDGDWDLTLFTCTRGGVNRVVVRLDAVSGLENI